MNEIQEILIFWYESNKRELPWRDTPSPYFVWLSEVILQQTRVNQGLAYFNRFVQEWPTLADLAHASEEEVLKMWQGLGYYFIDAPSRSWKGMAVNSRRTMKP